MSSNVPQAAAQPREPGVDAYRGLAVILMYAVHARRLQPSGAWEGSARSAEAVLSWLMWGEPFIAASFLFIVGFSLVLSRERAPDVSAWWRRIAWRAIGLYALAMALFVPHYGLALPDLLCSPGILSAIAVALIAVSAALVTPRPVVATVVVTLAALLVAGTLEVLGASVSGLNAGPGGVVPLLAFTSSGALLALILRQRRGRALDGIVAVTALPLVGVLLMGLPWTALHISRHPAYAGEVAVAEIFTLPARSVRLFFWNHTVAGYFGLLFPLTAALRLLTYGASWLRRFPLNLLGFIGRHALVAYVGHLVLLGLIELAGLQPATPWQTWGLVAALTVAAVVTGAGLEAWKRRPTTVPDRGSVLGADSRR